MINKKRKYQSNKNPLGQETLWFEMEWISAILIIGLGIINIHYYLMVGRQAWPSHIHRYIIITM